MGSANEVLHWYGQLSDTVKRMLALARARQWERLPELDTQCSTIMDQLKAVEPRERLGDTERERVRELVVRIRSDQDELTGIIRPQMTRLVRRMEQLRQQQAVNRAYRPLS